MKAYNTFYSSDLIKNGFQRKHFVPEQLNSIEHKLNVLEMYKIVKLLVQLRPKAYVVEGEIISLKDFKKNGESSLFNRQILIKNILDRYYYKTRTL